MNRLGVTDMKPKIAIIGAGLSGLTLAYRLFQHNYDIDVFEAKNRVGGRVFSVLMKNYLGDTTDIELGGQNITDGGRARSLLKLAQELNLTVLSNVRYLNELIYFNHEKAFYHDLIALEKFDSKIINRFLPQAQNIGQLIENLFPNNKLLQHALMTRMSAECGANAYLLSIHKNIETLLASLKGGLASGHEFYQHAQNQIMTKSIAGGNSKLPELLSLILGDKVHLNCPVKKIIVEDNQVFLEFNQQMSLQYDQVVLTIPTASYNQLDLSQARIPSIQLEQMKKLVYGKHFKMAFNVSLANVKNKHFVIKDDVISLYNQDETIQMLYINDKTPNLSEFLKLLGHCHPFQVNTVLEQNFATVDHNVYHDWKNDRHIQGSYSAYSVSISKELDEVIENSGIVFKKVFSPVGNLLYFAGEHTSIGDAIGTMDAAVESGERVAQAIMKNTPIQS